MKITKVTIYRIKIPLVKPYKLSSVIGTIYHSDSIIVKIENNWGKVGFGEAAPLPYFNEETCDTIETVITHSLGPLLIGENPLDIAKLNKKMDDTLSGNLLAKGAIDIALYDLAGKSLNMPINQFFGGPITKEVPLLWPIGSDSIDSNVKEVKGKIENGYNTFMIKTGELPLHEDIARVKAINKVCNHSTVLMVDANQGWQVSTAIEFAKNISNCKVTFIEQPIPSWDIQGLKKVIKKSPIPISVDESLTSIHRAGQIINDCASEYFSIKVSKHGGLSKSQKILALAEAYGVPCLMNSMIELGISQAASLQLGVTQENLTNSGQCFMSTLRISDDITNFRDFIFNGKIRLPEASGLGVEIDQSKLEKYTKSQKEIIY